MKIIDNISHLLGDDIKNTIKPGAKLKIAASCFSIYAYDALRTELSKIESLEFIFTSPTFVPNEVVDKLHKERREFFIPKLGREKSLYGSEFEIQLRNKMTQRAIAKECAEWIRSKATFQSNRSKAPMQQFISVDGTNENIAYLPISGFTAADLGYQKSDAVSNIVNRMDEPTAADTYMQLFNQIWRDKEQVEDVTTAICDHIESVYQENSPERIYFLMLFNIFNEFLEDLNEDILPNDKTGYQETEIWSKLFNFQRDAAVGVINKLEKFNGCILADSVGLGKTFTALGVIKYYELRNRSVLVLCPKKLDENWLNFNSNLKTNPVAKDRFNYDVLNHTDLSRTSGSSHGMLLDRVNWGNYDLVVIDESHNFRNNDARNDRETRYHRLMNEVVRSGVKTKVLMLSATPVNNKFSDLKNQLALAYEGDSDQISENLKITRSIDDVFKSAQRAFNEWSKLPAEKRTAQAILSALDFDFFELLDSVTIARSRKHIETFYDTSEIGKFPQRRKPITFHPQLTNLKNVIGFNGIFAHLSELKLSIYTPISYIHPSAISKYEDMYDTEVQGGRSKFRQIDREKSLQSLMTTNLLKRLESSVHSFRLTLEHLKHHHLNLLEKIAQFNSGTGEAAIDEYSAEQGEVDDEEIADIEESFIGNKVKINLGDMDLLSWEHDLKADLTVVEQLLSEMYKVTPDDDYKLQHLKEHIEQKIQAPINTENRKILIFTAFADTADYLYDQLAKYLHDQYKIHVGKVTGSTAPKTTLKKSYDFQSVLMLFSPASKEKAIIIPDEPGEIDVLIGTDCISEGQNLQDCDYLINYDIHWNPVRIIQRFGRIDRIGSKNDTIQLVNYWPDITLDEYINLKANDVSYRKEQLRRMQDEVVEMEDLKTGISITDLGLNDFRIDLLNYLKTHKNLENIPTGMHSVVPTNREIGLEPGVIFTLFNRNQSVNLNQQNRLHPYYLIYVSNEGEVVVEHTEVKRLLDLARAACKGHEQPLLEAYTAFNAITHDGRDMTHYSSLLDDAILSMMEIEEEGDIDSLFGGGKTSALTNQIEGLDDFALISFLVIQDID